MISPSSWHLLIPGNGTKALGASLGGRAEAAGSLFSQHPLLVSLRRVQHAQGLCRKHRELLTLGNKV